MSTNAGLRVERRSWAPSDWDVYEAFRPVLAGSSLKRLRVCMHGEVKWFFVHKRTALKEPYMAEGTGFWGVLESLYLSVWI